jgi:hypothetical protein
MLFWYNKQYFSAHVKSIASSSRLFSFNETGGASPYRLIYICMYVYKQNKRTLKNIDSGTRECKIENRLPWQLYQVVYDIDS